MTLSVADYAAKARIAAQAWTGLFGVPISKNALALVCAVADLETGMGNVPGHNWGSVHKRTLTPDEQAALEAHHLLPSAANLAEARAVLTPGASEMLFVDTGPSGPYFVWLWAFPSDAEAATKFLQVLVANRPGVRAILDTATPAQLAAAMYASKYFTGNSTDPQTNIDAYARLIASHANAIVPAIEAISGAVGGELGAGEGPGGGSSGASSGAARGTLAIFFGLGLAAVWLAMLVAKSSSGEEIEAA